MEGPAARQAQLTFAMARHALIDLGHVFHIEKGAKSKEQAGLDRLPPDAFANLCENLSGLHLRLCGDPASMQRLTAIRMLYEPHAHTLSDYLKMALPLWVPEPRKNDYWKTVAGLRAGSGGAGATQQEAEAVLHATEHVSDRSTAAHLHDDEHGF